MTVVEHGDLERPSELGQGVPQPFDLVVVGEVGPHGVRLDPLPAQLGGGLVGTRAAAVDDQVVAAPA